MRTFANMIEVSKVSALFLLQLLQVECENRDGHQRQEKLLMERKFAYHKGTHGELVLPTPRSTIYTRLILAVPFFHVSRSRFSHSVSIKLSSSESANEGVILMKFLVVQSHI